MTTTRATQQVLESLAAADEPARVTSLILESLAAADDPACVTALALEALTFEADAALAAGETEVAGRAYADVLGVDLAPEIIRFAKQTLPRDVGRGSVRFEAGDMLAGGHGTFDAVMAMDCLIHYSEADAVNALGSLAVRTRTAIVFTFAPRTLPLAAMHAIGRAFPRSDRAPSIVPVRAGDMAHRIGEARALSDWRVGRTERVSSGFYKSQMMELARS